jgi:transcription-repair coupling factor (superfamily II helicase)
VAICRRLVLAYIWIKNGKSPNLDAPLSLTSDINLNLAALIPDAYLSDVHQRLLFYKRISHVSTDDALNEIRVGMIDRFGLLPVQAQNLFHVHRLRLTAEKLGIEKMDFNAKGGIIEFATDTPVEAMKIIKIIQAKPSFYRMEGGRRLRVTVSLIDEKERLAFAQDLLQQMS